MAKARLFQAVCTFALLAAAPAFAQQTTTQPATTGAGNSVNAPVMHDDTAPRATAQSNMAPAERMDHMGGMDRHHRHHGGMSGHSDMHADAHSATDRLNEQSFQAAQRGQSFTGPDNGSSGTMSSGAMSPGTMPPAASGGMNDMSGGSPMPAASGMRGGSR